MLGLRKEQNTAMVPGRNSTYKSLWLLLSQQVDLNRCGRCCTVHCMGSSSDQQDKEGW